MYQILIKLPDKAATNGKLSPGVYRIGKSPASHIQLSRAEVSTRHAVLHVKEHELGIVDAGSTNGTYVDGKRIEADKMVNFPPGTTLTIGTNVTITINELGTSAGESQVQSPGESVAAALDPTVNPLKRAASDRAEQFLSLSGIKPEYRNVAQKIKIRVHEELLKRINLKNLTLSGADRDEVQGQARSTVEAIITEVKGDIPSGINIDALRREIVDEAVGLGPIESLIEDDDVTEIMVNGCDNIYIEKGGALYRTDLCYGGDDQVLTAIERIVAPLGRRIDESQPLVDARLPDGSRVNAIIPPLAIDGPSLTIRKFGKRSLTMVDLIKFHSITPDMADFLDLCVKLRKNILISGGTGSGKTTLLNIVSNYLPKDERIVTIEDAAELRLNQPHLVRLESRPPNIEGRGQIAIRDLVRNSLRMRPDRIVIGECRGGEALDMLQAMNTGHDGSLTTIHANSPRDAMARLETLVLMAGFDLPLRAIREQISSAISVVVQIGRMKDGSRKVQKISEITGMEGEVITTQDLFAFEQSGLDENGRVVGSHKSCNIVPTFVEEIQVSGVPFDFSVFSAEEESE